MRPFWKTILRPAALAPILPAGAAIAHPPLLAAPQNVTVTAAYRQMTLAWSASVGARGYNIYRGTAAGREGTTPIARGVTGPPYLDAGLANGTRYYYTVKAVGVSGLGAVSTEVSDTPHPSVGTGCYLITYWAGNSTPLVSDDNGAHPVIKVGPRGHGGPPLRPVQVIATFTFQPSGANNEPPSALILVTSKNDGSGASRTQYSGRNNPGQSFSVREDTAAPDDRRPPARISVPPPPSSKPTVSVFTPYQDNPDFFAGRTDALRALQNPDILLRRSGVEWLARWTQTDGGGGPAGRDAIRLVFSRMTELIPALTRGVREMPGRDSQQAARLLALIGTPARPAIPAVCAAIARLADGKSRPNDGSDSMSQGDLLNSLTHLCGGPDGLAPTLTGLLHASDSETRRTAAVTLRFCDETLFHDIARLPSGTYPYMTPEKTRRWRKAFLETAFPAVVFRLDDDAGAVRLAAAQTLEHWTYSSDAPWPQALMPLARAASSPDPVLRLVALRTLAYMPGDVSSVAPALRAALHGEEAERPWALAALSHAAWTGRARTLDAFLPDLVDPDAARRRLAAADLRLAAGLLWSGGFWPSPEPLPGWANDSRLMRVSSPPDATAADAQTRLLAALVRAAADRDAAVRSDVALSLEQISEATVRAQGHSRLFVRDTGTAAVMAALAQAASFLQETDPAAAKRLQDFQTRITSLHSVF